MAARGWQQGSGAVPMVPGVDAGAFDAGAGGGVDAGAGDGVDAEAGVDAGAGVGAEVDGVDRDSARGAILMSPIQYLHGGSVCLSTAAEKSLLSNENGVCASTLCSLLSTGIQDSLNQSV